jgi:formylmethanofuran dehydrogenase subunit E
MNVEVICEICGEQGYTFGEVRPNDRFICIDCSNEEVN